MASSEKVAIRGKMAVGFPVYAVEFSAATSTLFIAGGGGPGRSGVRNAIVRWCVSRLWNNRLQSHIQAKRNDLD